MKKELPMDLVRISRMIERDIFWALVGTLLAVVVVRFLLLFAAGLNPWVLTALLLIGAWSGVFLSHYSQRSDDALFDSLRAQTPQLRSFCLKVMLWLLGTAAVIGVLTVLTASYEVLGRLGGTVLATAIAAGFLWPLSLMVDRPRTLAAGLFGMASVLVIYCLILPLIWDLDSYDEEMFILSLVIGLTVPLGMGALLMVSYPRTRFAGRLGIVIYLLVVASFCVAIWHPGGWRSQADWWAIGWCLLAYGAISIVCLMGLSPTFWRDWRWVGVLASGIAWYLVTIHIWERQSGSPPEEPIVLFTSIGIFVAHTSLMLLLPLGPGLHWLRIGTMIAVVTTAVFLNLELLLAPDRGISFLGRVAGAGGVVSSCGTLALLIAARLQQYASPSSLQGIKEGELTEIMLYCPGCGKKQTIAMGAAKCEKCEMLIQISVKPKA
jgi:hypothetical protein